MKFIHCKESIMIKPKDIEEMAQKAGKYDEMVEFFEKITKYRDGLMVHQTLGLREKTSVFSKQKYKKILGKVQYYTQEKIFVDTHRIDATLSMAIQEELKSINTVIAMLSNFINKN